MRAWQEQQREHVRNPFLGEHIKLLAQGQGRCPRHQVWRQLGGERSPPESDPALPALMSPGQPQSVYIISGYKVCSMQRSMAS